MRTRGPRVGVRGHVECGCVRADCLETVHAPALWIQLGRTEDEDKEEYNDETPRRMRTGGGRTGKRRSMRIGNIVHI